jgi:hypothetical protein
VELTLVRSSYMSCNVRSVDISIRETVQDRDDSNNNKHAGVNDCFTHLRALLVLHNTADDSTCIPCVINVVKCIAELCRDRMSSLEVAIQNGLRLTVDFSRES